MFCNQSGRVSQRPGWPRSQVSKTLNFPARLCHTRHRLVIVYRSCVFISSLKNVSHGHSQTEKQIYLRTYEMAAVPDVLPDAVAVGSRGAIAG